MNTNKKNYVLSILLFLFCILCSSIDVKAETHSMYKIGSTQNNDHVLWYHSMSGYGDAYCLDYGFKASNRPGKNHYYQISSPFSASITKLLRYAATVTDGNYLAMQSLVWSIMQGKIYLDEEENIVFTKESDKFAANMIITDPVTNSGNGDICSRCGGYGELQRWTYHYQVDDGWWDSDGNYHSSYYWETSDGGITKMDESKPSGNSYYYSKNGTMECDARNCDGENYWASNGTGSDYGTSWNSYCEMKYKMQKGSRVPSCAAKTEAKAIKQTIHLKWNGKRYEATLSDANDVIKYYNFKDQDGFHFSTNSNEGLTYIYYNGSDLPQKSDDNPDGRPYDGKKDMHLWETAPTTVKVFAATNSILDEMGGLRDVQFWQTSCGHDFQRFLTSTPNPQTLTAYIAVVLDKPEEAPCESKADIEIIDINNKVVDYMIPGEKYKLRYTFSYTGKSKGYAIRSFNQLGKSYLEKYYVHRHQDQYNNYCKDWDEVLTYDNPWRYEPVMVEKYEVKMQGTYTVKNSPYEGIDSNKLWDSEDGASTFKTNWNEKLYLDAIDLENTISSTTNHDWGNYKKTETGFETTYQAVTEKDNSTTTKEIDKACQMKVERVGTDEMKVTFVYEVPYQVFRVPITDASASIRVEEDFNEVKQYRTNKYKEESCGGHSSYHYDLEETQTENSSYPTAFQRYKTWKLNTDIKLTELHVSSGDGVTIPVDINNKKMINYHFYYGIELTNPDATIDSCYRELKNGVYTDKKTEEKDHTIRTVKVNDIIETDVTTQFIINGEKINVMDHIQTGTTLLQRTLPVIVAVGKEKENQFQISVNTDATDYNLTKGNHGFRTFYETEFDLVTKSRVSNATNNTLKATDKVYKPVNPKNESEQPYNIANYETYEPITQFYLKIAGKNSLVRDTYYLDYKNKNFSYDLNNTSNGIYQKTNSAKKVIKQTDEKWEPYYKYSTYNYQTLKNGSWVSSNKNSSTYTEPKEQAKESYKLSSILFKSNYTYKHNFGEQEDGWVDMVNDNENAIVAAGQGFELKVQITYTNNNLVEYLKRVPEKDSALFNQTTSMSSKNSKYGPQYANLFLGTTYKKADTGLPNDINILGSNIYEDLYVTMSDNPKSVYSYSGVNDTVQIWDLDKKEELDYKNNTVKIIYTYSMKLSTENGVTSRFQNMKFFTNQLAPDGDDHSITLWTAIFPGLEIDNQMKTNNYDFDKVTRYLGDYIKLGYSIKSTGADDSIVHIVQ